MFNDGGLDTVLHPHVQRVGKLLTGKQKARLLRVTFNSLYVKHQLLSHAKDLREAGIRIDDDLTRKQQDERQTFDSDFKQLKVKGYKPFFRGSQLRYQCNGQLFSCNKGQY